MSELESDYFVLYVYLIVAVLSNKNISKAYVSQSAWQDDVLIDCTLINGTRHMLGGEVGGFGHQILPAKDGRHVICWYRCGQRRPSERGHCSIVELYDHNWKRQATLQWNTVRRKS
mmetsp:Transcript_34960/g.39056  ORF Transcript_34960/g.39056 Transcript_34960/m.39056 type:complete len:116 (+) Transcript_34960:2-349(+)